MIANRCLAFLLAAASAAVAMTAAFNLPWLTRDAWAWDVLPILAGETMAASFVTVGVTALPWLATEVLASRAGRLAGGARFAGALLAALAGNALMVLFARSISEGEPERIGVSEMWWRFLPITMTGGVIGGLAYGLLRQRALRMARG